mmetsp:Transcript_68547/g.211987  ORF Transcript_68547/g.211987 Transcript_68547/m.211987 type:complete len:86 (-) Transcript_68547:97-354(-)
MPSAAGLRLFAAALVCCCSWGALGLGDESLNPACWINWKATVEEADGTVTEGDACHLFYGITVINVIFFYTLFWFVIRVLILSTQ